eukprot:COSAG02_NODE_63441_length_263_cov_0.628049_1_plen_30_part_01
MLVCGTNAVRAHPLWVALGGTTPAGCMGRA